MQNVTINDVAKYAGVSKKTVSRVLNDEPNVSDNTLQKVRTAFEALSYRPSKQARGLASNQSFLIGLVYDNPNNSYVSDIQTGALNVCNTFGYHLLIHPTDHSSDGLFDNLTNLLNHSRLDGLVLTPPFSDMLKLLAMLDKIGVPYVRIAPTLMLENSASVISNEEEASFDMTEYLISLGHTQIGFIKGHPDHSVSEQRLEGYLRALESNNIESKSTYVEEGFFTFSSGEQAARKLLTLKNPPSAIFASNDYMAAGILKVARQKNISIPHNLSVTGFDNAPISRYLWPSLTTIQLPAQQMASTAVEMLIASMRNRESLDSPVQLKNQLIIRESTAPVR